MKESPAPLSARFTRFDLFIAFNSFLFLQMCIFVYFDRFVHYRGLANIHEFFIYAGVILLLILVTWNRFRHLNISSWVLLLIEIGILMHFAGAFIQVDGHRLYDSRFLDIRFDKYVHFVNAMIATLVTIHVFQKRQLQVGGFMLMVAVLVVLGLGGINEIVEYIVTLTVEHNGVGAYHNNMLDLVANLLGSISAALVFRYAPGATRRAGID